MWVEAKQAMMITWPEKVRASTPVCTLWLLQVQVIPWVISDSNYVRCPAQRLDPSKTVFVGALHGMLNAEALASIMNDLFGGVMYAGIDTDKHKYPIGEFRRQSAADAGSSENVGTDCAFSGSGRVTFNNQRSYLKAVCAAFVEIKTPKFTKKVKKNT